MNNILKEAIGFILLAAILFVIIVVLVKFAFHTIFIELTTIVILACSIAAILVVIEKWRST